MSSNSKKPDRDITSLYQDELGEILRGAGEPAYRAGQLFSWLHQRQARSYEEMTDLPRSLREMLAVEYPIPEMCVRSELTSKIDGTKKFLFSLGDDNIIESVWMQYHHGNSVCVSSQVGCRMGCRFCASTVNGLARNLSAGEMLGQVYLIRKRTEARVDNVVIMGSGEPLENYENTLRFIRLLTDPAGTGLSTRSITLSTCGLVPEIRRLAGEQLGITLAVSLHAPTDAKRRSLMPVANRYPLAELMEACRAYSRTTGRRVTFEYSLIAGVNDSGEDARQLAKLLHGFPCHVNLIPVNAVRERKQRRPDHRATESFHKILEKCGINGTIRRALGADIEGACGQLRNRYLERKQADQGHDGDSK